MSTIDCPPCRLLCGQAAEMNPVNATSLSCPALQWFDCFLETLTGGCGRITANSQGRLSRWMWNLVSSATSSPPLLLYRPVASHMRRYCTQCVLIGASYFLLFVNSSCTVVVQEEFPPQKTIQTARGSVLNDSISGLCSGCMIRDKSF